MALTEAGAMLLGAGLGLGGSLISTGAGASMNKKTRQWQEKQNEIERQRQDTAWQRTVRDMQMAGLNPALATGGADTAGANLNPVSPADMSGIADGINSVLNRYQQKELAQKDYEYKITKLESDKVIAEAAAQQAKANAEEQVRHNMEQERLTGISYAETERHNKESERIQEQNGNYLNKLINGITNERKGLEKKEGYNSPAEVVELIKDVVIGKKSPVEGVKQVTKNSIGGKAVKKVKEVIKKKIKEKKEKNVKKYDFPNYWE